MTGIARNVLLVLFGRGGFLALSLISYALIFRMLGYEDAGRFAMCIVIVRVLADCLGEPLDMAIMRDVPPALKTDRRDAFRRVRGAFLVRIVVAAAVVVIISALSPWIASAFFHSTADADLVVTSALGAAGVLLFRANLIYFQCEENFPRVIFTEGILQVGRFAAIAALGASGVLTPWSGIVSYVAVTYVSFLVGVLYLPPEIRKLSMSECSDPRSVLHYAKWMVGVTVLAAVYERINEFLIARFQGPGQLAFYSAAMILAMLPEFLTGCLSSVYQPRTIVAFRSGHFRELRRSYLKYAVPSGAIALVIALALSGPVITVVFGNRYEGAIPVFRLLVSATLIWLALSPLPAILMVLLAPRQNLLLNIVMFVLTLGFGCWIVPQYGAAGGAALFLATRILNLIAMWGISEQLLRENEKRGEDAADPDSHSDPKTSAGESAAVPAGVPR